MANPTIPNAPYAAQPADANRAEPDDATTTQAPPPVPTIDPEPPEKIRVGAGGKLIVPREDIDADLDDGVEIDLVSDQAMKIRKPSRREWIALFLASELPTRMLLDKPKPADIDTDFYYVDKSLRGPINDELKEVRVFPYYSFARKAYALLIVNVTPGNTWYESIAALLKKPAEFFAGNAVRIKSDRDNSCYRVKAKPMPSVIACPDKSTGELLAEALGPDHFISSPDHPIYRELIDGTEI